jgi:hypothetical protein
MKDRMEGLLRNRNKLSEMGESARRMSVPDSSSNLAQAVLGMGTRWY